MRQSSAVTIVHVTRVVRRVQVFFFPYAIVANRCRSMAIARRGMKEEERENERESWRRLGRVNVSVRPQYSSQHYELSILTY